MAFVLGVCQVITASGVFLMVSLVRWLTAVAVAAVATAGIAAPGRLPDGVTPVHYAINVAPDAAKLDAPDLPQTRKGRRG